MVELIVVADIMKDTLEPKDGRVIDAASLQARTTYTLRFERGKGEFVVTNLRGMEVSDVLRREQSLGGNPVFYVEGTS